MGKVSKFSPIFVNITLYRQLLCFAFTLLFFQNIEQRIFGEYDTKIENFHLTERRYTNCTTVLVEFANTTGDSTDAKRFHIFFISHVIRSLGRCVLAFSLRERKTLFVGLVVCVRTLDMSVTVSMKRMSTLLRLPVHADPNADDIRRLFCII